MVYIFKAGRYTLPLGEKTYVMAVINLTPDSFCESSRFVGEAAVRRAVQAVGEGADIIDIGAQSTAPGSTPIGAEQEQERLLPVLEKMRSAVDAPISVDTYFPSVAQAALQLGADIINDVSGSFDEQRATLAKRYGAGWIVTHTGGMTSDMSGSFEGGAVAGIAEFFAQARGCARHFGVGAEQLCFDPGIGFGKTREDDLALIAHFAQIRVEGCAMLAALSRKRVARLCGDALVGTVAANTACILGGADIIRVHDVKEGCAAAKMADLLRKA